MGSNRMPVWIGCDRWLRSLGGPLRPPYHTFRDFRVIFFTIFFRDFHDFRNRDFLDFFAKSTHARLSRAPRFDRRVRARSLRSISFFFLFLYF